MVTVQIGPLTESYELVRTTAPPVADGGGVVEIYDDGQGTRYVLVPESQLAWQEGRNHSGLWSFQVTDAIDQRSLSQQLWKRLVRKEG